MLDLLKQSLLLIVTGVVVVVTPCVLDPECIAQGITTSQAVPETSTALKFAVVTIKPNDLNDGRWILGFTHEGYKARGVTALQLIQEAYGIFERDRISGGPKWIYSQKYDLVAKVDDDDVLAFQKLDLDQRRIALQEVLSDRFKLRVNLESKELPIYTLTIGKKGPRLQETKSADIPVRKVKGYGGTVMRSQPGELAVRWFTMPQFASLLSRQLDRQVIDKTGLTGHYDFSLDWTPDNSLGPAAPTLDQASSSPISSGSSGPSIFTAVKEQLGLELKTQKGPVEILVVNNIDYPSAN